MAFPKPAVDLADIRRKYHAAAMEERGGEEEAARRETPVKGIQGKSWRV